MLETHDGLEGSVTYWHADSAKRAANCNGAGTAGWQGDLVPDTLYGLNINPSADIHDWDYGEGQTLKDKKDADFRFLRNMFAQIRAEAKGSWHDWFLKIPRMYRALMYYVACSETDTSVAAFNEAEIA